PRRVNGGTFLGLNGIAVKSHGGTDAFGFASAVDLAYEMADSGLIARLTADIDGFHHRLSAAAVGGAAPAPRDTTGSLLGKA
ncbi:MAG: phosphate acyltransferase, partial [Proteobacteria bacterium]|nr:phosphate acyltransferase [Pseudomonadota bacterium]